MQDEQTGEAFLIHDGTDRKERKDIEADAAILNGAEPTAQLQAAQAFAAKIKQGAGIDV